MLQSVLNYSGDDMEELFSLYFEVMQDSYGNQISHNLIENGSDVPVTQENKHGLYIDLLNLRILD
jgi:hypothetical protein